MLHARNEGESFGLACGEFSIRNKPVLTWDQSRERNHIMILGDQGIYYHDIPSLTQLLVDLVPQPDKNYNCYQDYTPEKVMQTFNEIYLK
jgi:hypothetical protein